LGCVAGYGIPTDKIFQLAIHTDESPPLRAKLYSYIEKVNMLLSDIFTKSKNLSIDIKICGTIGHVTVPRFKIFLNNSYIILLFVNFTTLPYFACTGEHLVKI
jgi:hypothetical protein